MQKIVDQTFKLAQLCDSFFQLLESLQEFLCFLQQAKPKAFIRQKNEGWLRNTEIVTWFLVKEVEICMNHEPTLVLCFLVIFCLQGCPFCSHVEEFRDESLQFVSKQLPIVRDAVRFGAQVQLDPCYLEDLAVLHLYFEEGVLGG